MPFAGSCFVTTPFVTTLAMVALLANANADVPANPERPLSVETCEEALKRVQEAEVGSPLLSRVQNRRVLENAKAKAAELCR